VNPPKGVHKKKKSEKKIESQQENNAFVAKEISDAL
jgi:hypothetical protein